MKIKKLEIRNALGIKELSLEPGKTTVIQGGSEQGKSSIIEAIEKGIRNTNKRAEFVRAGENEALIYMEFDNGVNITRKVRNGKSDSVKVTKDGAVINSPEAFLKSLANSYAFSPVSFMNHTDKEQTEMLLGMIPITLKEEQILEWFGEIPAVDISGHGLSALKSIEQFYYNKRTETSRELKTTATQLDALALQLPINYNPADWENVSLKEKYDKIKEVEDTTREIQRLGEVLGKSSQDKAEVNENFNNQLEKVHALHLAEVEKIKGDAETKKAEINLEISELQQKIADRKATLEGINKTKEMNAANATETARKATESVNKAKVERLADIENRVIQAQNCLENANDLPDIEALKAEAENIEKMKGFVRIHSNVEAEKAKLKRLQDSEVNYNAKISTARQKPGELLAVMEMPVSGLGINDSGLITINELPIRNLSTSQQIKLALEIARETAGELKLICVDQFETLDADRRAEFLAEIEKDDFRYFITQVTNGELSIETSGE